MFNGEFKSKPTVTLRGSSQVKHDAKYVIAENRERRETRQTKLDREDAATTIQSAIRGFLVRSHVKQANRQRFDQVVCNSKYDVLFLASLLCNFFNPRVDHERLETLIRFIKQYWRDFTAPNNAYIRICVLVKCLENCHHKFVVEKGADESSLDLISQITSDPLFVDDELLDFTSEAKIPPIYVKLIELIDFLVVVKSESHPALLKLLQILNRKYYSHLLNSLVLNTSLRSRSKTVDILSSSYILESAKILDSLDINLMTDHISYDFNANLHVLVDFLSKLIVDESSYRQVLGVLFKLFKNYVIVPPVYEQEIDSDDSDSEQDMEIARTSYNFECLDLILSKCSVSSNLEVTHIVYILIAQFKMSVIQTLPIRRLCFNVGFVRWLWEYIITMEVSGIYNNISESCVKKMTENKALTNKQYQDIIPVITVFANMFYQYLLSSHDADFLEDSKFIFSSTELINICLVCRDLAVYLTNMDLIVIQPHKTSLNFRSSFTASRHISIPGSVPEADTKLVLTASDWMECYTSVAKLSYELYHRDSRVNLITDKDRWLSKSMLGNTDKNIISVFVDPLAVSNLSLNTVKYLYVLQYLPFIVPFDTRISVFHDILDEDKKSHHVSWGSQNSGNVIKVTIRRDYIYEDAYAQLTESSAPDLKRKIMVQLINYVGLDEAGVDGGGLFREFLSSFLTEAFNPNRGFFVETDGLLHPNPAAQHLYPDFQKHFFFIGRLLGKAIYEKLLVDIPLASYFLHKLLGGEADINHLRSLDSYMYKNILSLRGYSDEVIKELCLSFIVSDNILGNTKTIELKLNGASIPVTRNNLIEYIHLMADYRLNRQIRVPFRNFAEGFYSVLSPDWLKMFSYLEFQSLISGSAADVNILDLKENTVYQGNYSAEHPIIVMFWEVVEDMSSEEHRKLLAFVTSTNRTPLLGFKGLNPLFGIHSAGIEDRLPTSSTCMNLLKLPEFSDIDILRKRLKYVIESEAGFELS